jgi:hypothetical protein
MFIPKLLLYLARRRCAPIVYNPLAAACTRAEEKLNLGWLSLDLRGGVGAQSSCLGVRSSPGRGAAILRPEKMYGEYGFTLARRRVQRRRVRETCSSLGVGEGERASTVAASWWADERVLGIARPRRCVGVGSGDIGDLGVRHGEVGPHSSGTFIHARWNSRASAL